MNGVRARGGYFHSGRAAGRSPEDGPSRAEVALAACLPAALVKAEEHVRLDTAPPGARAQASGVTAESGLHAAVQVARRAREAPVKMALCASPECEGPPPHALVCKRALPLTVRVCCSFAGATPCVCVSATRPLVLTAAASVRAGVEPRALAVRVVSVVQQQPGVGGGDPGNVKYGSFATHALPFETHDAAAHMIDAMTPRVVGALLCDGVGWLHPSGALRREPDVLPFGRGVASTSAGAQPCWAAVSASVCGAPSPDAPLP